MDLSIGIITAPRPVCTLDLTVAELRHGGFDQTLHIFAEPGSSIDDWPDIVVSQNDHQLGMWRNWLQAAAKLLQETDTQFILICEDDLLVSKGAAAALKTAMETIPLDKWGIASLYTPRHNVSRSQCTEGWNRLDGTTSLWGSLAYCFTRESLIDLLHSQEVILHLCHKGTDSVVPAAMRACMRTFYSHVPSLCAHSGGGVSTVSHPDMSDSVAVGFSPDYHRSQHDSGIDSASMDCGDPTQDLNDVSIIIKTFERRKCLQRLLASLRLRYPTVPVIIADDSREPYAHVFRDAHTMTLSLPFDSGVSAGRNAALKLCTRPYFVLCDDDFEFDDRTDLSRLRWQIEKHDLDLLGGEVMNDSGDRRFNRPIDYNLSLTQVSSNEIRADRIQSRSSVNRCDVVANFFIARTDVIRGRLGGWDDDLKTVEHTEFFIRAKQHQVRTAYTPNVSVRHWRTGNEFYNSFRRRINEFISIWMRKHGLTKFSRHNGSVIEIEAEPSVAVRKQNHRKQFEANLRLLNDTLRETALAGSYWLGFGALLGYQREGALLQHDPDADFGVFEQDRERFLGAIDALVAAGFRRKFRWTNSRGEVTEYSFVKDGVKFEFFIHSAEPASGNMRWYLYDPGRKIEYHREQPICDLQNIRFLDRYWSAPRDIDAYLTQLYGDWRTPDRNFREESRPCTVRQILWSGTNVWD